MSKSEIIGNYLMVNDKTEPVILSVLAKKLGLNSEGRSFAITPGRRSLPLRMTVFRFLFWNWDLFRISKFGFRILAVLVFSSLACGQSVHPQVLFRAGEGAYNNYRIPAIIVT